jgi:hypothetical protein
MIAVATSEARLTWKAMQLVARHIELNHYELSIKRG